MGSRNACMLPLTIFQFCLCNSTKKWLKIWRITGSEVKTGNLVRTVFSHLKHIIFNSVSEVHFSSAYRILTSGWHVMLLLAWGVQSLHSYSQHSSLLCRVLKQKWVLVIQPLPYSSLIHKRRLKKRYERVVCILTIYDQTCIKHYHINMVNIAQWILLH